MKNYSYTFIVLGFILGIAGIVLCVAGDRGLPIPLTIVSAGFCISGAILEKKS